MGRSLEAGKSSQDGWGVCQLRPISVDLLQLRGELQEDIAGICFFAIGRRPRASAATANEQEWTVRVTRDMQDQVSKNLAAALEALQTEDR